MIARGSTCRTLFAATVAGTMLAGSPASNAGAQEMEIGMREYMMRCAGCHGPRGAGDGPMADLLKIELPDLTRIAQRNGGVFPVEKVYQSIDGRLEIAAHGTRDMPLWGDYFTREATNRGASAGSETDQIVMGRILSIVYYLQAIQRQ